MKMMQHCYRVRVEAAKLLKLSISGRSVLGGESDVPRLEFPKGRNVGYICNNVCSLWLHHHHHHNNNQQPTTNHDKHIHSEGSSPVTPRLVCRDGAYLPGPYELTPKATC